MSVRSVYEHVLCDEFLDVPFSRVVSLVNISNNLATEFRRRMYC